MADQHHQTIPIACHLSEQEFGQRRQTLVEEIFGNCQSINEVPEGYEFHFPAQTDWLNTLTEFIEFERNCCPFLTFELIVLPKAEGIVLRLGRGPEIKVFIRTMLQN